MVREYGRSCTSTRYGIPLEEAAAVIGSVCVPDRELGVRRSGGDTCAGLSGMGADGLQSMCPLLDAQLSGLELQGGSAW